MKSPSFQQIVWFWRHWRLSQHAQQTLCLQGSFLCPRPSLQLGHCINGVASSRHNWLAVPSASTMRTSEVNWTTACHAGSSAPAVISGSGLAYGGERCRFDRKYCSLSSSWKRDVPSQWRLPLTTRGT